MFHKDDFVAQGFGLSVLISVHRNDPTSAKYYRPGRSMEKLIPKLLLRQQSQIAVQNVICEICKGKFTDYNDVAPDDHQSARQG